MQINLFLAIYELAPEFAAYSYVRVQLNRWGIHIYQLKTGLFQFNVRLPWFSITNAELRRIEEKDGMSRVIPVVTWQIWGWRSKS